jgi:hypothetical protein
MHCGIIAYYDIEYAVYQKFIPKDFNIMSKKTPQQHKHIEDWYTKKTHDIKAYENKAYMLQKAIQEDQNLKSPVLANRLAARYGIKSPIALVNFLRSPGGKALKSLLIRKLDELKALREQSLEAVQEKQREHSLIMLILALAYQEEKEENQHLNAILQEEQIEKQLHKTPATTTAIVNKPAAAELSAKAYQDSLNTLHETIGKKSESLDRVQSAWDALDKIIEQHNVRKAFLHEVLDDIERLLDLSPEEEEHLESLNEPALKLLITKEHRLVSEGSGSEKTYYLIPKASQFNALTPEERHAAQQSAKELKLTLGKTVNHSIKAEEEHHTSKQNDLIHQTTRLHQDLRVLSQQCIIMNQALKQLQKKPAPTPQATPEEKATYDTPEARVHASLTKSYKLLHQEASGRTSSQQRAPISKALDEERKLYTPENVAATRRRGDVKFLPEEHQPKAGENNLAANQITYDSLRTKGSRIGALITQTPLANQENDLLDLLSQPGQLADLVLNASLKKQQEIPSPKPSSSPSPSPSPFNMTPY